MILHRRTGNVFTSPENWLVNQFCRDTGEYVLMLRNVVPPAQNVYFHYIKENKVPSAFLWTALQKSETGRSVVQVHALYVSPKEHFPRTESEKITRKFESILNELAKEHNAEEIGFYTRRNPNAFIRRLNRTSPRPWMLDSHVVIRRAGT